MTESALIRVERVCSELATKGEPITFTAVAEQAQISRATLYRDPQLRAIVDEHRTRQTDARTLTGLATEVLTCAPPSKPSPTASNATKNNSAKSPNHHPDDEPFHPKWSSLGPD